VADHQRQAALVGQPDQRLASSPEGDRLFDKDVLAGFQCSPRQA